VKEREVEVERGKERPGRPGDDKQPTRKDMNHSKRARRCCETESLSATFYHTRPSFAKGIPASRCHETFSRMLDFSPVTVRTLGSCDPEVSSLDEVTFLSRLITQSHTTKMT
jgi:hypothetical protein